MCLGGYILLESRLSSQQRIAGVVWGGLWGEMWGGLVVCVCGVGWGECGMDNQASAECVWTHVPAFFVERLLAGVWRQEHLVSRRSARP